MMITLALALALIMLALLTVMPEISQQVRRDREEELMHRGTAYMRAVQHYYRKFNRYPSRVEDLENTNNMRFLRRRYTDPINRDPKTGKERDFKFLRQQDISLNNGPTLGPTAGQLGQSGGSSQGSGQGQGGFGSSSGGLGGFGAQSSGFQQTGSQSSGSSSFGSSPSGSGSSSSGSSTSGTSSDSGSSSSNSGSSNGPTFGGGPILGVASMSKDKSIRVFYQKNHYNDWLFIYLPNADRGGLLTGPVNPGVQTMAPGGSIGGLTPAQISGGALGQGGFGQGMGQGQGLTPNGGQNQGLQTQTPQTPATPQQQQ